MGWCSRCIVSLAYTEGDSPADPSIVIEEVLGRLDDFIRSYPGEAALLFVDPLTWEMEIEGEIIYELEESDEPLLDYGMYLALGLSVWVYEAPNEAAFDQALTDLGSDSPLGRAIHDMLHRLALMPPWDVEGDLRLASLHSEYIKKLQEAGVITPTPEQTY